MPSQPAAQEAPTYTISTLIQPVKRWMIQAAVLSVISAIVGLGPYIAITEIARILITNPQPNWAHLSAWAIGAIVTLLIKQLCYQAGIGTAHLIETEFRNTVRQKLAAHLQKLPLGWFTNRSAGEVRKIILDDVSAIHTLVAHAGSDVGAGIAGLVASLVYLFTVDWRLTLVLIGWLVLIFLIGGLWVKMTQVSFDRYYQAEKQMSEAAVEIVDGIAEVKNYGLTKDVFERFDNARQEFTDISYEWLTNTSKPYVFLQSFMLPAAICAPIVGVGMLFAQYGWIHPVDMLPFIMLGVGMPTAAYSMFTISTHLHTALESAQKVCDVLNAKELAEPDESAELIDSSIEFDQVNFGYNEDREVLHKISLRVAPGTMTALVGASGSGKTTLARLAARFWDPQAGRVLIGGVDVRELRSQELLSAIALVFQEIGLLRASVSENIALSRPDASQDEIIAAAKAACIHDRIMTLPKGYDTILGERGAHLSGGEAQRVTIARAILADAPILVLDEATAYADPHSERQIQLALSALAKQRTMLVIAHRLASVKHADQIVVLDDGKIIETGTHDELLAADGRYAAMWRAQNPPELAQELEEVAR